MVAEHRGDLLPAVDPAQLDLPARHEAEQKDNRAGGPDVIRPGAQMSDFVEVDAPLAKWLRLESFDSAKECEEKKTRNARLGAYAVVGGDDEASIDRAARATFPDFDASSPTGHRAGRAGPRALR